MPADPTFIGSVQSVSGGTVAVALRADVASGLLFVGGEGYRVGQVGSFVRIPAGYTDLFGLVTKAGAGSPRDEISDDEPYGHLWIVVELAGEGSKGTPFRRGISQYPTIGDPVHLLTDADLARVYGRPQHGRFASVGRIASAESVAALLDVDRLVSRHSAVIGSTGSGKSTTVAALMHALSNAERFPSARIVVVDIHGEYAKAFGDRATVFRIGADPSRGETPLYVPYWALLFEELTEITLGDLGDTERGYVRQRVEEMKRDAFRRAGGTKPEPEQLTVDAPVPFSLHELWLELHKTVNATYPEGPQTEETAAYETDGTGKAVEKGDALAVRAPRYKSHSNVAGAPKIRLSSSPLNMKRPVDALASRLRDRRLDFLFRPGPWLPDSTGSTRSDLSALLKSWIGGDRPIAVLDLSGIPSTVLTTLIGALLRVVYDCIFWAKNLPEGGRERPLLVVLEEAHTYLGTVGGNRAAESVRRIVKEGRKYGIGAMLVSQRPSEIDGTILSQCGTLVAMRLTNTADRGQVAAAVQDNLEGLLATLPALRTGEAIIVGEAVHLPMRVLVDAGDRSRRPDSEDPRIFARSGEPGGWTVPRRPGDYQDVVDRWRQQEHVSSKVRSQDSVTEEKR